MSDKLTIEELAHASGMTVRNIRNHQSRGLLAPPEVVARIGYYGPEHLERLRLIREMQDDGFNLGAIKNLLSASPGSAEQLARFRSAIAQPDAAEAPEVISATELAERFRGMDPRNVERAVALGVLLPLGEDKFEVLSPAMLRAAEEAVSRGVSMRAALQVVERLRTHSDAMARAFVKLFLDELWKPIRDSDEREQRWPEVVESLERLRPVASETVLSLFRRSLGAEMQRAFERELDRQAKRAR
ncbi:MAG: MerR family transcriptional regulator [Solirubrobacteraceae bacterium]